MKFITTSSGVEALLPVLMEKSVWGYDTETTGLDARKDKVVLAIFGRPDEQYVIDTRKASLEPLRPFLESREHKKIGNHTKFDYKMTRGTSDIAVEGSRCTMMADQILNNGRKFRGFSLDALLLEHLGITIDKSLQKSFIDHKGDFSPEQLGYAATDGRHLLPLAQKLSELLLRDNLHHTWHLENEVMPCFGDMEFDGFHLDVEGWKRQMAAQLVAAEKAREQLDIIAEPFFGRDLFGNSTMNYRSPEQCLELLKRLRVRIKQEDRQGRELILPVTDTSDGTLMQLQDYPVVRHMQDYRSYMTRLSSFGQSFIDAIHPNTGKIHFEVDQLGTETGRPAKHKEGAVNPLNIPKENEFRHCFLAPPDYLCQTDDFTGCEARIWAEISGDPALREAFAKGIDIHCYVASKLFGVEVTKKNENAKLRTPAKNLNFGIIFGLGVKRLYLKVNSEGFKISHPECGRIHDKYAKEEFKTGIDFLRGAGRLALEQGYLHNLNGRRRYWLRPDPNNTKKFPRGAEDEKYKRQLVGIQNAGGNFLIQSMNAEMTKTSMVMMRDYIKKNRVRATFFNQVYDEVVTFCHKDDEPGFTAFKRQAMKDAAHIWMKSVKMEVDGHVRPYWTKE